VHVAFDNEWISLINHVKILNKKKSYVISFG
jgi:hypothetical protein